MTTFDRAVHTANHWIGDVQAQTGWSSRQRALEALLAVLQVLRDRLSVRVAVGLGAQLPVLIRGFYFQNWEVSRGPEKYRRRKEFFERVSKKLERFRISADPEVLTRAVIRSVSSHLAEGELRTLRRTLPEELRRLWPSGEPAPGAPLPAWYRREQAEKATPISEEVALMKPKVKDLMTRDVEVAGTDMTLRQAAERMRSRNIGSLPVCEGRRVVGIVTDRDLAIRAMADGRDANEALVGEVMTRNVVTCHEDDSLEEAETLMHDRQVRRLPILNAQDELVGYLAIARLARIENESRSGKVLKGISQPARPEPLEIPRKRGRRKSG